MNTGKGITSRLRPVTGGAVLKSLPMVVHDFVHIDRIAGTPALSPVDKIRGAVKNDSPHAEGCRDRNTHVDTIDQTRLNPTGVGRLAKLNNPSRNVVADVIEHCT